MIPAVGNAKEPESEEKPQKSLNEKQQGLRASPQTTGLPFFNGRMVNGLNDLRQVEAKYPALLFKQQLTAFLEKIYGMIRDNLKKEISPLLGLCIQLNLAIEILNVPKIPPCTDSCTTISLYVVVKVMLTHNNYSQLADKESEVRAFLKDKELENNLTKAHVTLAHKRSHGVTAVATYGVYQQQKVPVEFVALLFSDNLAALEARIGSINGKKISSKNTLHRDVKGDSKLSFQMRARVDDNEVWK
ncbi:hypothetical protein M5K25_009547 [Dendrobium thyrsiflorum]|uniref:Dilute domain-containing protein n=1 Tax=Dendrobium thyrsiflorum TaxID=117978 RepID=A0ABD0VCT8_DENTH